MQRKHKTALPFILIAITIALLGYFVATAMSAVKEDWIWDHDMALPIENLLEESSSGWSGMGSKELDQTIYYDDIYYHFERGEEHLKVKCNPKYYNRLFYYLTYTPQGESEYEEVIFCEELFPCKWTQANDREFIVRFQLRPETRVLLEEVCAM